MITVMSGEQWLWGERAGMIGKGHTQAFWGVACSMSSLGWSLHRDLLCNNLLSCTFMTYALCAWVYVLLYTQQAKNWKRKENQFLSFASFQPWLVVSYWDSSLEMAKANAIFNMRLPWWYFGYIDLSYPLIKKYQSLYIVPVWESHGRSTDLFKVTS